MDKLVKICQQCSKEFETTSPRAKYCCNACKSKAGAENRKVPVICEGCGIEFRALPNKGQKYCSIACAVSHTKIHKTLICQVCGREFEFTGRTIQKRCPECKAEFRSLRTMERRAAKDPTVKLGVGSGHAQTAESHSTSEARKARRELYKQKVADGDYSATYTYRNKVITGHDKCELCGFDKYQSAIVVHHKDMNRTNNDVSNLAVICANCHAEVHSRIRKALADNSPDTPETIYDQFKNSLTPCN